MHAARASIKVATNDKSQPLHAAASGGNVRFVQWLLGLGASATAKNDDGETPLYLACVNGYVEAAKLLHEAGASVDTPTEDGELPIHAAVRRGHVRLVQWLIGLKVKVNANGRGSTPLYLACGGLYSGHLQVAQLLHAAGASITLASEDGKLPIHAAAEDGSVELLQWLLDIGADATSTTSSGQTPLHFACRNDCLDAAQLLHSKGAKIDALAEDEEQPIHAAAKDGSAVRVLQWLVNDVRAHVTATTDAGETPMHLACAQSNPTAAQILHSAGASIEAETQKGQRPLHVASEEGELEIVQWLVKVGAQVDAQEHEGEGGCQPLHLALGHGHLAVSRFLVGAGASIDAPTAEGDLPIHTACKAGELELVEWLHSVCQHPAPNAHCAAWPRGHMVHVQRPPPSFPCAPSGICTGGSLAKRPERRRSHAA